MPGTLLAAQLTNDYRQQLFARRQSLQHLLGHTWDRTVDPNNIAGTFDTWHAAAVGVVTATQGRVAGEALAYEAQYVAAETDSTPALVPVDVMRNVGSMSNGTPVAYSLGYPRIEALKVIKSNEPVQLAMTRARTTALELGSNAVLSAARDTLRDAMLADDQVEGWQRVGSLRCCAFCAMLISRGPVYRLDTVRFRAHTHCTCSAEPVVTGIRPKYGRARPYSPPATLGEVNAAAATAANQETGDWTGHRFRTELESQRAALLRQFATAA